MPRKSLSDILQSDERERLSSAWDRTEAAEEFAALTPGEYIARIENGELAASKAKGTPSYKLVFRVAEGQHTGRRFYHDVYLTPAALPMAKRDLAKLGVVSLDQLEQSLPQGIVCRVKLALRTADDGSEFNSVKSFAVERIEPPQADPFAPPTDNGKPPQDAAGGAA